MVIKMKKKDKIFLITMAFLCVILLISIFAFSKTGEFVEIYVGSRLYKKVSLYENREINIDEKNIVVIENGSAYMKYADCPDKLCVKMGKITKRGSDIICLPNRVRVEISGGDTDAVAG